MYTRQLQIAAYDVQVLQLVRGWNEISGKAIVNNADASLTGEILIDMHLDDSQGNEVAILNAHNEPGTEKIQQEVPLVPGVPAPVPNTALRDQSVTVVGGKITANAPGAGCKVVFTSATMTINAILVPANPDQSPVVDFAMLPVDLPPVDGGWTVTATDNVAGDKATIQIAKRTYFYDLKPTKFYGPKLTISNGQYPVTLDLTIMIIPPDQQVIGDLGGR